MAMLVAAFLLAPVSGAVNISHASLDGRILTDDDFSLVSITRSTISGSSVSHASIETSTLTNSQVSMATMDHDWMQGGSLDHVRVADSRLVGVSGTFVEARDDVTACSSTLNGRAYDACTLLGSHGDARATITQDAPASIGPNETYSVGFQAKDTSSVTFDLETALLPVENKVLGARDVFDVTAKDAIATIEVSNASGVLGTGTVGSAIALGGQHGDTLTAKITTATKVIDTTIIQLRAHVNGGALLFGRTSVDVIATSLAFVPVADQPFAPYISDDVARLVGTVPLDKYGNTDRTINVSVTETVVGYDAPFPVDSTRAAALHGDSEFGSATPILYDQPTSPAAHHPSALELIIRQVNHVMVPFGYLPFHATHLITLGPYEATVNLTATATNELGATMTAEPLTLVYAPAPDAERRVSTPFGAFTFPGRGSITLHDPAHADMTGTARVTITETPNSHNVTLVAQVPVQNGDVTLTLPSTIFVPFPTGNLPFGNFVPNKYVITSELGGKTARVEDGGQEAITVGRNDQEAVTYT